MLRWYCLTGDRAIQVAAPFLWLVELLEAVAVPVHPHGQLVKGFFCRREILTCEMRITDIDKESIFVVLDADKLLVDDERRGRA